MGGNSNAGLFISYLKDKKYKGYLTLSLRHINNARTHHALYIYARKTIQKRSNQEPKILIHIYYINTKMIIRKKMTDIQKS